MKKQCNRGLMQLVLQIIAGRGASRKGKDGEKNPRYYKYFTLPYFTYLRYLKIKKN